MKYYLSTYAPVSKPILDRQPFATLEDALLYVVNHVARPKKEHVPLPVSVGITTDGGIYELVLSEPAIAPDLDQLPLPTDVRAWKRGIYTNESQWFNMHVEWLGAARHLIIEREDRARDAWIGEKLEGNRPKPLE